ncbi:MAG TPA: sulfite exporter TauE/SafE family protein [Candidatus Methylomirabilis sp.]|nr:sulfite exporter TauE/SafE family protein [Candidatus Methylomirabilis sp.]
MSRIITWNVTGMTCHSCEKMIGSVLNDIPGVEESEVSLKQGRAGVSMRDEAADPDIALLNARLGAHGYALIPEHTRRDQATDTRPAPLVSAQDRSRQEVCRLPTGVRDRFSTRLRRALVALFAVGVASVFILGPLRSLVPNVSASASIGAMIAFGLVASVSTCLSTTGGFLMAYNGASRTKRQLIAVHLGRLSSFLAGGALLGFIGRTLPGVSENLYGLLALVLGTVLLLMGLHMLDLSPSLAKLGLTLPRSASKLADRVSSSDHTITPYFVGAVTFMLPCGFTQTAQALALASDSPVSGMLLMGAFALGTLPVLAGISTFGSARVLQYRTVKLATGAVLSFFAFGQIDGGLTVMGAPVTPGSLLTGWTSQAAQQAIPAANAQEQVVRMTVASGTYAPKVLTVKKGVPVRWEIDGQDVGGCASSLVMPTYGIRRNLTPGLNIIQFTPKSAGAVPFSCGMGMIRGSFNVTD